MSRAINIKYPIQDDNVNNFFLGRNITTKDAIRSNLLLFLNTLVGERYYMPDYGLDLYKYLFEPNDDIVSKQVLEEIKKRVDIYIPEVTINSIVLDKENSTDNSLILVIDFRYNQNVFNESDQLVINVVK